MQNSYSLLLFWGMSNKRKNFLEVTLIYLREMLDWVEKES